MRYAGYRRSDGRVALGIAGVGEQWAFTPGRRQASTRHAWARAPRCVQSAAGVERRKRTLRVKKEEPVRIQFVLGRIVFVGILLVLSAPARAADPAAGPDPKELQAVLDKAIAYLRAHQGEDGSFSPKIAGPGISALVVAGLVRNGVSVDDPLAAKTLAWLEKRVKGDGGIYDKGLANYTTSVALMAFHEANPDVDFSKLKPGDSIYLPRSTITSPGRTQP